MFFLTGESIFYKFYASYFIKPLALSGTKFDQNYCLWSLITDAFNFESSEIMESWVSFRNLALELIFTKNNNNIIDNMTQMKSL